MPLDLTIQLLGGFRLTSAGTELTSRLSPRQQTLLAYLLLHPGQPITRQRLAFLFWSDTAEKQARTNLRHLLHGLRSQLPYPDEYLISDGQTLSWNESAACSLDVTQFERLASRAETSDELRQAVSLYTGELLPDCYDDWIVPERERLQSLFLRILERLADALEAQGDDAGALQAAQRLLQGDPLGEEIYQRLMRLHARRRDPAALIRTYEACVDRLRQELGIEPSEVTQELFRQLTQPGTTSLESQPALTFRLDRRRGNLPVPLDALIGRVAELAALEDLLAQYRLVTLTGFGGVGKTRLALEAAQVVRQRFVSGAWWVDLAPLADPAQIEGAIADSLRLPEQTGARPDDALLDFIGATDMLLVVDNCEHVLDGVARLLGKALQACPNLKVLATSRLNLRLPGEAVFAVPPLQVPEPLAGTGPPDLDELAQTESIRLFVERGVAVAPGFGLAASNLKAVVEICRRLEGIPLAIELAAARLRLLSAAQIASRLGEAFQLLTQSSALAHPRHRTLRAALDWSYALLSPSEQIILRRTGVFAGSFNLDAAEKLCGGFGDTPERVLDALAALVDHSLLKVEDEGGEVRYNLHEVTRQYVVEKLYQTGELEPARRRHLEIFCQLAEEAEPLLRGGEQLEWLRRLDLEGDNLRLALRWGVRQGERDPVEAALRMSGALWLYWFVRGRYVEGLRWTEAALKAAQSLAIPEAQQVKALNGAASFTIFMGEFEAAIPYTRGCLVASRRSRNVEGTVLSLHHMGMLAMRGVIAGSPGQYFQEGLELARSIRDNWLTAILLSDVGSVAEEYADWGRAWELFQEKLVVAQQVSDSFGIYYALLNLAYVAIRQGEWSQAESLNQRALALARRSGDVRGVGLCLIHEGQLAIHAMEYTRALSVLQESLAMLWEIRDRENSLECLAHLAIICLETGEARRAVQLLAAIQTCRAQFHLSLGVIEAGELEALGQRLRLTLGDAAFEDARVSGQILTLEEAIQLAGVEP